ncbi:hypothetical protein ACROYT_G000523 [Oculina patagonica]
MFIFICFILFVTSDLIPEATCSQGSGILYHDDIYSTSQSVRQNVFLKDEFHYLTVPRVGVFTVHDAFDCTFECLSNHLCLSVNLAASKGADGKLWCELLSSDKYRNSTEYKGNKSSHHFYIKCPCSSSPCQNDGTCVTKYNDDTFECLCKAGFTGKYCEKRVKSCKEAYDGDVHKSNASQLVTLYIGSKTTSVLCHFGDFGCGDGGWTPVMKIDGNKNTFDYTSGYWTDKNEYNLAGGETGFDSQETKLPTYWNTSFSKICLGMKVGQRIKFAFISKTADSLYSLIADGQHRATSLGRDAWKTMIGSQAYLQDNCNSEGFNAPSYSGSARKSRIGILGNNENDCITCDSLIGFGNHLGNTCGDASVVKAIGYILVQ